MVNIVDRRYKILNLIGRGGFGETYLAEDKNNFNSLCVVKKLKPMFSDSARLEIAKKLFQREAKTLKKLGDEHNQIPRLLAYFSENQEFYLVQELIEGDNLENIFAQHNILSETKVIELIQDVLEVLKFVHENNVIHRDIKPANLIQRKKDGKIVLIDFGAVKETLAEGSTIIIGTHGYMPVEQSQGKPLFCSDIYALGIVAIAALTGLKHQQLTRNSETDEVNELITRKNNPDLVRILNKMVRTDFQQRYQTASAVLLEISKLRYTNTKISPSLVNNKNHKFFPHSLNSRINTIAIGTASILILAALGIHQLLTSDNSLICLFNRVPDGTFSYSGSTTWASFRQDVEKSIQNICPNFELTFVLHTPGQSASTFGIQRLLEGQRDFSISSRHLTDNEYENAKSRGIQLKQIPIAIDATAVAVNHNLNLQKSGLTLNELKGILTGKITNWNQLGLSRSLPITVYTGKNSSHLELIKKTVLDGEEFTKNWIPISGILEGVKKVSKDEGGIYISSAAHLVTQCGVKTLSLGRQENQLISPYKEPFITPTKCTAKNKNKPNSLAFRNGQYPLTNRLFVIMKEDSDRSQKAGEAFANLLLTPPRQEIIEKAGFVRMK
jgi:serine/threonine protein kinase